MYQKILRLLLAITLILNNLVFTACNFDKNVIYETVSVYFEVDDDNLSLNNIIDRFNSDEYECTLTEYETPYEIYGTNNVYFIIKKADKKVLDVMIYDDNDSAKNRYHKSILESSSFCEQSLNVSVFRINNVVFEGTMAEDLLLKLNIDPEDYKHYSKEKLKITVYDFDFNYELVEHFFREEDYSVFQVQNVLDNGIGSMVLNKKRTQVLWAYHFKDSDALEEYLKYSEDCFAAFEVYGAEIIRTKNNYLLFGLDGNWSMVIDQINA